MVNGGALALDTMSASDSDQRSGWKYTTKRGRPQTSNEQRKSDRSPSKLTKLFRGISETVAPPAATSPTVVNALTSPTSVTADYSYDIDSRRNAVLLDMTPEDLRPPSSAGSTSTSHFSLVFPPSPPPDSLQHTPHTRVTYSIEQIATSSTFGRSYSRRFLPKLKSHLSNSSRSNKLFSIRKRYPRYSSGQLSDGPLDGEEGELIDEACFMDSTTPRGIGQSYFCPM
jgi:hypothetical protein